MRRSVPSSTRATATARPSRSASFASRASLVALVAAFGLSGCGGDDKAGDNASATAATAATSPPAATTPGKPPTKAEESGIQATNAAAYAAVKAKDGTAFCALLTKEAIDILTAGSPGKESAVKKCASIATKIAEGAEASQVTPKRLTTIRVSGDTAVGQAGQQATQFERVDGKWLLGISQGPAEVTETTP